MKEALFATFVVGVPLSVSSIVVFFGIFLSIVLILSEIILYEHL